MDTDRDRTEPAPQPSNGSHGGGRTLVMTGATSGIGRVAAEELLRRDSGLHLVLLARGRTGATTRDELASQGHQVTHVEVDLVGRASVQSAVDRVLELVRTGAVPPLTGFAGNAGLSLADANQSSPDGVETTFAVNVMANHLLIAGLAPNLPADGRIVITTSDTHFGDLRHGGGMPRPIWSDPDQLARPGSYPRPDSTRGGRTAYTTSKLAVIYLVHEWARRLPDGPKIISYNPALVPGTGLSRDGGVVARFVMQRLTRVLAITGVVDSVPVAGRRLADAIAGEVSAPTGSYIDRGNPARSSEESYNADRERRLWEYAEGVRASIQR